MKPIEYKLHEARPAAAGDGDDHTTRFFTLHGPKTEESQRASIKKHLKILG